MIVPVKVSLTSIAHVCQSNYETVALVLKELAKKIVGIVFQF
jgi:hypothetical protein